MVKIADSSLKTFADTGPDREHRSVIVELAAPTFARIRSVGLPRHPVTLGHDRGARAPLTEHGALLDELDEKIAAIVPGKVVRLDSAEAFVLEVNPAQLRAVAALDLVGSVRLNRTRRR